MVMVKTSNLVNEHALERTATSRYLQNLQTIHCAVLGDGMVGKTCMTISYTQGHFIPDYAATVYEEHSVHLRHDGEPVDLLVFDTAGQSDFEALREHTYRESEVLVFCFSVCDRDSYASILTEWAPEIKRHTKKKLPIVLVGTQTDLRRGRWGRDVQKQEGQHLAKVIGADVYLECSARTGEGLREVFDSILTCALTHRRRKNGLLKRLLKRR